MAHCLNINSTKQFWVVQAGTCLNRNVLTGEDQTLKPDKETQLLTEIFQTEMLSKILFVDESYYYDIG